MKRKIRFLFPHNKQMLKFNIFELIHALVGMRILNWYGTRDGRNKIEYPLLEDAFYRFPS